LVWSNFLSHFAWRFWNGRWRFVFKIESVTCPQNHTKQRSKTRHWVNSVEFRAGVRLDFVCRSVEKLCGLIVATNLQNIYSGWLKSSQFMMPSTFGIANIPPISNFPASALI
jgi:hypothetical protein